MMAKCTKCGRTDDLTEVFVDKCTAADLCTKCIEDLNKFLNTPHGILLELTEDEENSIAHYRANCTDYVEFNLANGTVVFQVKGGKQE